MVCTGLASDNDFQKYREIFVFSYCSHVPMIFELRILRIIFRIVSLALIPVLYHICHVCMCSVLYHIYTTIIYNIGKLWMMGGSPLNNEVWTLVNVTKVSREMPLTRSM
jgi:hypothetical protein